MCSITEENKNLFYISRITYQSEENGYTVTTAVPKGKTRAVCLVGCMSGIEEGMLIEVNGEWVEHPTYGKQFKVFSYKEVLPEEKLLIKEYLSSRILQGVGQVIAGRMVDMFGKEIYAILDNADPRLKKVKGISEKTAKKIFESWAKNKALRELSEFLMPYGISTVIRDKLYRAYGSEAVSIIKQNPYRMITDVEGVGFKTADTVAGQMGIGKDSPMRIDAGCYYVLENKCEEEGHTYLPKDILIEEADRLLCITQEVIRERLEYINHEPDSPLYQEDDCVFTKPYYYMENNLALKIKDILKNQINKDVTLYTTILKQIEEDNGFEYDEIQRNAIKIAMENKCVVITGGPGTGKTTITRAIVEILYRHGMTTLLAAPTGKAAKRMKEVIGHDASTIHRLLGYTPQGGFMHNEEDPLVGDVIIIDEASMINIRLANSLFKAIPPYMKVILIGDINQLPAVGAGNVLNDIIESATIPVIKLEKVYRQASESKIITTAHSVNNGIIPTIENKKTDDLFFMTEYLPENIIQTVVELVSDRLPRAYKGINPMEDIQVLIPMKEGVTGIINYNKVLQNILNPKKKEKKKRNKITNLFGEADDKPLEVPVFDYTLRVGDKVMQTENNYDKGIMNGDVGYIKEIRPYEKAATITFDDADVDFTFGEMKSLILAYASTIHKSQGSEYNIVILPLTKSHGRMLERNLLYTAITRAKKLCIMVGDVNMLVKGINTITSRKRLTKLKYRLCNVQ